MSRHRAVRNLDLDDVLDDEYDEEYDENTLDENEMTNEDLEALDDGLSYVYSVVGDNCPLTDVEIKEALWYYYFDKKETINWALNTISERKAKEEKLKAKAAKAEAAVASKGNLITCVI
ncbi:hypothetical protein CLU79DRAFT_348208 [Phycomyces nitens]|nr:hypothetical protein CLU79DRAFT_348208 [Phycomyces nitens]